MTKKEILSGSVAFQLHERECKVSMFHFLLLHCNIHTLPLMLTQLEKQVFIVAILVSTETHKFPRAIFYRTSVFSL